MAFLPSTQENVLQNLQYAAKLASEKCGLCPKLGNGKEADENQKERQRASARLNQKND